ncbi:ExeA family protein [Dyella sp. A6]|uniref:ExeA family protein n=1 Tax=Dyella aluminiiresistens TaxID=3069105 RepID=UPI002E781BBE|nr:AAA family ATPase [Dyella sp. A6]
MAYLLYGLEQGEGFVMITGPVGTGKTLLIQRLLGDIADSNVAMASIASANLGSEDILPAVASAFGLPYEGHSKEGLLQELTKHFKRLHDRQSHALLVVDEAQTLSPAALEMLRILSNLEHEGRALMQVFLVGQSELRRLIIDNRMEQLRQRVLVSHKLEPLGDEESRDYILHRLHAVGWNHDPAIAPEVFTAVYHASRGIPRRINLIMDRLLLHGYLEELHELDGTAASTVLDEIHDEMPEMPSTLEAPAVPDHSAHAHKLASPLAEDDSLENLDGNASKILLHLMRETIRLRETLRDHRFVTSVSEAGETVDAWHPDSAKSDDGVK